MKNLNSILKIVAIISLFSFLISLGLLEYHRSFDPYGWMESGIESVESRNLFNQRKWQYFYFVTGSFLSLFLSTSHLVFNRLINRNTNLR